MAADDIAIRPSADGDIAAIAAIYAHHVRHGLASFEEVPPPADEIARRRGEIIARGLPYLVAARGGQCVGYCYAGPFRPRSAYRFTLEDSIYIDPAETGCGIGRRLLGELLTQCAGLGYRQMIAVIGGRETLPSIRLHAALGFAEAGILAGAGFKFGRWVDLVLMQAALGPGQHGPAQRIEEVTMAERADPAAIAGYHAHVYYDPVASRGAAAELRQAIAERFPQMRIGSWHDEPVGPHGVAMYQVVFGVEEFPRFVPWLMLNRGELNVLVHPQTGDAYADHTAHALWLGAPQKLRPEILRRAAD